MDNQRQDMQNAAEKKGRRTRTDPNNRNFVCGCGKSYLSYPALYTHIKQKHNGQPPQDTKKPTKNRGQRGRPTTTSAPNDGGGNDDDNDNENLSSDSNDALNIIEELVLYVYQLLNKDLTVFLNDNQSNSLQDIQDAFPSTIFSEDSDYFVIQNEMQEIFNQDGLINEGELQNGIYLTKCNLVFGVFIFNIAKHLKGYALREIVYYCCLFRKALNEKGWKILEDLGLSGGKLEQAEGREEPEFCEANSAQNVLEISNEFITEILPQYLEKYQPLTPNFKIVNTANLETHIIKITQYFCNWLYAKRYTNSMLERNDDDPF